MPPETRRSAAILTALVLVFASMAFGGPPVWPDESYRRRDAGSRPVDRPPAIRPLPGGLLLDPRRDGRDHPGDRAAVGTMRGSNRAMGAVPAATGKAAASRPRGRSGRRREPSVGWKLRPGIALRIMMVETRVASALPAFSARARSGIAAKRASQDARGAEK